jgi:hypothetical protein
MSWRSRFIRSAHVLFTPFERITTFLAAAFVFAAIGLSTASARADYTGYVCYVTRLPSPGTAPADPYGTLIFAIWSGAGCTGTLQHTIELHTASSTGLGVYSRQDIGDYYDTLMRAMTDGLRVVARIYTGPFSEFLYFLQFRAD